VCGESRTADELCVAIWRTGSDSATAGASDGRNLGRRRTATAFTLEKASLAVTRHIAVVSGSPTFEVWTTFKSLGGAVSVVLSFVTDQVGESIENAQDLSLYFRSRMAGILGLCFRGADLSDTDVAGIQREIATYKSSRATQSDGSAALLSTQANFLDGPAWDILQETSADGSVLLYAFENGGPGSDTTNVVPKDLQPELTYLVHSVDAGALGQATGAELMAYGITLLQSPTSASHLLTLIPQP
jgi:hypothetical protein